MNARSRARRGFTLVEVLVVLLLAGMISAILMQALGQVFQLQSHFGVELFRGQQGAMYADWFRQSINGMVPDRSDGQHRFKGEARELGGLTLAPLDTAADALQPFSWRIRFDARSGDSQLVYGAGDAAPVVMAWRGDSGRFAYLDETGASHDQWPPALGKAPPQLPRTVTLEYDDVDGRHVVTAAPRGPQEPLPRQQDID